ncbi:MAG: DeoR/GlpR transcriptional regulator [Clostridia bacterium]|nr:DeoR/GlpR transcriptional regulator [Clostridia bacterium]
MLENERQEKILEYIVKNKSITIKKLMGEFFVSEATARRDLKKLAENGMVKKVFGGATLINKNYELIPYSMRETENRDEKDRLCKIAAEMVKDGDVIYLDGSSTTYHLLPYLLKFKDLKIVTNGLNVMQFLYERKISAYGVGGHIAAHAPITAGYESIESGKKFNFDISFMSVSGLDEKGYFSGIYQDACELQKAILKQTETKVMIMSRNKINKRYPFVICTRDEIDNLITTDPV